MGDSAGVESAAGVVVAAAGPAAGAGDLPSGAGGDETSSSGASAAEGVGTDTTVGVGAAGAEALGDDAGTVAVLGAAAAATGDGDFLGDADGAAEGDWAETVAAATATKMRASATNWRAILRLIVKGGKNEMGFFFLGLRILNTGAVLL